MKELQEQLDRIESMLLNQKNILNVAELSTYTGWSVSKIHKLTAKRKIPFHKESSSARPHWYKRQEIDDYLTAFSINSDEQLNKEANNFLIIKHNKNGTNRSNNKR